MKKYLGFFLAPVLAACQPEPGTPVQVEPGPLMAVDGARVRTHMVHLSSDQMEGRETGTAGYLDAAQYVAEQFESMGLAAPALTDGYLQSVPFLEATLDAGSPGFQLDAGGDRWHLVFPEDFLLGPGFDEPRQTFTGPLVFVGHGVVAPEYGHDDYAHPDVRGKLLIALSGAPASFATDQRAYYSSGTVKKNTAMERGALALIQVRTPVDQARLPWQRLQNFYTASGLRWLHENGDVADGHPGMIADAWLNQDAAKRLFSRVGHSLDALFEDYASGRTGGFEIGASASVSRRSESTRIEAHNVVGMLRGSDPGLRDEYVVLTAHLDHLGGEFNGAYDNAAGVGILLEVARALTAVHPPPRRSILFVALAGEEKGLRGSSYFAQFPPIERGRLVANINMDMPYLGFPIADVEAFGAEHSSLHYDVLQATQILGMELTPDPMPDRVRFVRSDQFSFVQEGVPSLALKAGGKSADPAIDGQAMLMEFLSNHYHQPSDDASLPFSETGARRFAQVAFLLALEVANAQAAPRWNDGDFFGDLFDARD